MKAWSWGKLEFDWTVAGPFESDYTTEPVTNRPDARESGHFDYPCWDYPCHCGELSSSKANDLGKVAAANSGVDVSSYDYVVYWMPGCPPAGFSGTASVGGKFSLINGCNPGSAQTLGHELGHNCAAAVAPPPIQPLVPLCICVNLC